MPRGIGERVVGGVRLSDGRVVACQVNVLQRWPDGGAKWALVTWQMPADELAAAADVTCERGQVELLLAERLEELPPVEAASRVCVRVLDSGGVAVDTGVARFLLSPGDDRCLSEVVLGDDRRLLGDKGVRIVVADRWGKRRPVTIRTLEVLESGSVRAQVGIQGVLGQGTGLRVRGTLSFFAGSSQVRLELTAENPRRARHPGGYWDLGDPGSVLLKQWSLEVDADVGSSRAVEWREQPAAESQRTTGQRFSIHQESSGGENWNCPNHLNREGRVPLRFRGYRVRTDSGETSGERARPVVAVRGDRGWGACAVEEFWEKFPTGISVEDRRLNVKLWPSDFGDLHELQAGEHATRVVWLDFGSARDAESCEEAAPPDADSARLAWIYDPPRATVSAEWIAGSGCLPFFPSSNETFRDEFLQLTKEALEGEANFFAKREAIDEFGWRNFGDVWADHEEAYCEAPKPVISHYNNQYDLLHSLLVQYLLTGDRRWWSLADPLARHIVDIDIYHTDRDKPAYNGGLFWHTAHYHTAGRCSHRTMSVDMKGQKIPAEGTGPGNEHNYSSGLLLYYWLTGNQKAREAVIGLADWVIAMDDGNRHIFGLVSQTPTGDASRTTLPDYHGPGRGAGNSINSLVNGWKLTGCLHYLEKAQELIYRTIHPRDNIEQRRLLDVELRWSYTVYLQSLLHFIDATAELEECRECREYARESVLHYARWMAANETFYLDHPEKLEYPTETWAAQELRKGTVLLMAARHASDAEAATFRARAREILDQAWRSLMSFPTRIYSRPLAVALQQGQLENYLVHEVQSLGAKRGDLQIGKGAPNGKSASQWPAVSNSFVPQKAALKAAIRSPRAWLTMAGLAMRPSRWARSFEQTWAAERIRRLWE